jgi:polysaccharide biosynthesis/export protein
MKSTKKINKFVLTSLVLSSILCGFTLTSVNADNVKPTLTSTNTTPKQITSDEPYVIGIADQIDIKITGHSELDASVVVLQDGTISVAELGIVKVSGLTIKEFTTLLTKKYSVTINDPEVTVSVRAANIPSVNVIGAVKIPGVTTLKKETKLIDILTSVGGLAQAPDLTTLMIIKSGNNNVVNVDLEALITKADLSQNVPISAGDVLIFQAKNAEFSSIQITGEVLKPGAYDIPKEGVTIASALLAAGGATQNAMLSQVQVLHNGKVEVINVLASTINVADPNSQKKIYRGDVLQVPANLNKVSVIGMVEKPADYTIPDNGSLTVSEALVMSGGPTSGADLKRGILITHDNNWQVVRKEFNVGEVFSGKTADIPVRTGDVIYVIAGSKSQINAATIIGILAAAASVYNVLK